MQQQDYGACYLSKEGLWDSKQIILRIIVGLQIHPRCRAWVPNEEWHAQLCDCAIMAATLFFKIMALMYNTPANDIDFETVETRVAIGVAINIAIKYQLDVQPIGPLNVMLLLVRPDDGRASRIQMVRYMTNYELHILNKINIYRCARSFATIATDIIFETMTGRQARREALALLGFLAFHASALSPRAQECVLGTSLAALVLALMSISDGPCKEEFKIASRRFESKLDLPLLRAVCCICYSLIEAAGEEPSSRWKDSQAYFLVQPASSLHKTTLLSVHKRFSKMLRAMNRQ